MARDRRRQMIVDRTRHGDAVGARHQIGARTVVRQHLDGDSRLVHSLEAAVGEVGQELRRIRRARGQISGPVAAGADDLLGDALAQRRDREMLLEGDSTHGRFSSL